MGRLLPPIAALTLAACATQSKIQRATGAPRLAPSGVAERVAAPPAGAMALGSVTVHANDHQTGASCEEQAVFDARKLGAMHVVVVPLNSSLGRGPKCRADAYYVAPSNR